MNSAPRLRYKDKLQVSSVSLPIHRTKANYHLEFGVHQFHRCSQILLHIYHKATNRVVLGVFNLWNEFYCIAYILWWLAIFQYNIREIPLCWYTLLPFTHSLFHFSFVQQLIGISWWTSILIILPFFFSSLVKLKEPWWVFQAFSGWENWLWQELVCHSCFPLSELSWSVNYLFQLAVLQKFLWKQGLKLWR